MLLINYIFIFDYESIKFTGTHVRFTVMVGL